jgi:hypothetical protein
MPRPTDRQTDRQWAPHLQCSQGRQAVEGSAERQTVTGGAHRGRQRQAGALQDGRVCGGQSPIRGGAAAAFARRAFHDPDQPPCKGCHEGTAVEGLPCRRRVP